MSAVCINNKLINLLLWLVFIPTLSMTAVIITKPSHEDAVRTFSMANITVTKVVTASQATTTTKSALLTCTTLAPPLAISPCRRRENKELMWTAGVVPLFYYAVAHEDIDQFHSVNPTHVFKVEPSAMPEESMDGIIIPIVTLADVVESSFSRPGSSADADGITTSSQSIQSLLLRFADRNLFSSFFSSLLAGLQFPTIVTVTSTETLYTAISTATLFTSTSTYTLSSMNVPCLPVDFVSCPSEIEESITEDPSTEDPSTDII